MSDDLRGRHCRYGFMVYSINDFYIGRSLEHYGEYCEQEVALFRQLVRPGQVVVDAGANIGAHSVFFAQAVGSKGRVHAFEPQRVIYQMLCANLAFDGVDHAATHHAAVGQEPGRISVPVVDYGRLGNFGGLSLTGGCGGEEVPLMTIDGLQMDRCDFIKIDVQGMESDVLAGAEHTIRRFRPLLYVENDVLANSEDLIGMLFELGYRLHWHMTPLFNPSNFFGQKNNIFGTTVTLNMACFPKEDHRTFGLRQITSVTDWWDTEQARPLVVAGTSPRPRAEPPI